MINEEYDQSDFTSTLTYVEMRRLLLDAKNPRAEYEKVCGLVMGPRYIDDRVGFARAAKVLATAGDDAVGLLNALETARTAKRHPPLALPPGYWVAEIAKFLLTREAFRKYVAPTIADMQSEHKEAIDSGYRWHARWIYIRGHLLTIPGWIYAFVVGNLRELLRRGR